MRYLLVIADTPHHIIKNDCCQNRVAYYAGELEEGLLRDA